MSMLNEGKDSLFSEFSESSYEEWKEQAELLLKGASFEKKLISKTYEGIDIQPIYTSEDLSNDTLKNSVPGVPPFSRHSDKEGYIDRKWEINQEIPGNTPETFNKNAKKYLSAGQSVVNIPLNVSGSDNGGLRIEKREDLEKAIDGLDTAKYPLFVYTGRNSEKFLKILIDSKNAYEDRERKMFVGMDPISESLITGEMEYGLKDFKAAVRYSDEVLPNCLPVMVRGDYFGNFGASAVQEIAVSVSTGTEYIRNMLDMGFSAEKAASKTLFFLSVGQDFFMEIAKFRAARILWSRILESFGCAPENRKMYMHAVTSRMNMTVSDPYVNMLRVTSEAFSAVLGGVDSLCIGSFDEIYSEKGEFSGRISRNLHSILKDECQLFHPIDPAGGSWYVEKLTEKLALEAWKYFQKIEHSGGIIESLKKGFIQDDIGTVAKKRLADVAKRKNVIVGSNMFADNLEKITENYEKMKKYRTAFEPQESEEYVKIKKMNFMRISSEFEDLRYKVENSQNKKVLLLNMGPLRQHKPRADFSRGFFEVAGFEVCYPDGFDTVEKAVDAAVSGDAKIAVICSTDETYPELVPAVASGIKEINGDMKIVLAGRPAEDMKDKFDESGVDDYIFLGADCLNILRKLAGAGERI